MTDFNGARPLWRAPALRDACALGLLGLLFNLNHLSVRSLDLDESVSAHYGRLSLMALAPVLAGGDSNMGFYHLLLNVWVRVFGDSEVALRGLSAVFGALAISALYLIGARLFGRTVGIVAGLMLALTALVVENAQTVRGYALVLLLATLSSYFLAVELEEPSKRNRFCYVVTSVLAVYAHYFAVYLLVAQVLTVVMIKRWEALKRKWLEMAVAIVLLCCPAAIFLSRDNRRRLNWLRPPSPRDLVRLLQSLAGGSSLVLLVLLAGGCYATISAIRNRRVWPLGLVATWLLVPILTSFAVSIAWPMFQDRYLIVCVPALILFGAATLARLTAQWALLIVAPLLWLSTIQVSRYYARGGENWRGATIYVLDAKRPGDAIMFYPNYAHYPFDYYRHLVDRRIPASAYDRSGVPPRIWLMVRKSDIRGSLSTLQRLQSSLARSYHLADQRGFRNVEVDLYLWDKNGASPSGEEL